MKREATEGTSTAVAQTPGRASHAPQFVKVKDGRNQPIRGLWKRNERYYAQIVIEDARTGTKKTRRVPLMDKDGNPVASDSLARAALERLRTKREDDTLPVLGRTPKFSQLVTEYIGHIRSGKAEMLKRKATIDQEDRQLAVWCETIGEIRVDKIKLSHVNAVIRKLKNGGLSNRTVNTYVISFRNAMKHAKADGHILALPTQNLERLKESHKKRALFTPAELEKVCAAAFGKMEQGGKMVPVTSNAQQFVDYIRLMAYCGARRNEALRCRWQDVSFDQKQLTIDAGGEGKNHKPRQVDFNAKLEAHLRAMHKRRAPDSQWLFPSPRRGEHDTHLTDFSESHERARKAAGLPNFKLHDCRHLFISFCVMSGIDFMTIAEWVGHTDGGILVGKVYGHLADSHKKEQAKRVSFEPQIVKAA